MYNLSVNLFHHKFMKGINTEAYGEKISTATEIIINNAKIGLSIIYDDSVIATLNGEVIANQILNLISDNIDSNENVNITFEYFTINKNEILYDACCVMFTAINGIINAKIPNVRYIESDTAKDIRHMFTHPLDSDDSEYDDEDESYDDYDLDEDDDPDYDYEDYDIDDDDDDDNDYDEQLSEEEVVQQIMGFNKSNKNMNSYHPNNSSRINHAPDNILDLLNNGHDYYDEDDDEDPFGLNLKRPNKHRTFSETGYHSKVLRNAKSSKKMAKRHGVIVYHDKEDYKRDRKVLKKMLKEFIPGSSNWTREFRNDVLDRWMRDYCISKKSLKKHSKQHVKFNNINKKEDNAFNAATSIAKKLLKNYNSSWADPRK